MSTELSIALLGVIAVAIPAAVEIWKVLRRRSQASDPPTSTSVASTSTAQPLREEAAEALMEMPPLVRSALLAEPGAPARQTLQAHIEKLFRLRARLGVAHGITDGELEAFTDAAARAVDLARGVDGFDRELTQVNTGELDDASGFDNARKIVEGAEESFRKAWEHFEEVARAASTGGSRE